jgi:hypothetical protein
MITSGPYISAHANVLLQSVRLMAEARAESLLKAYEKEGIRLDETAEREITNEVRQFCDAQQNNAIQAINQTIQQTFQGPTPPNFHDAIAQQIASGVRAITSRLVCELAIKRDEVLLEEMKVRKVYAAGLGKRWDVFISHASEDKGFVGPLAAALQKSGLLVWYDDFTLTIGDSLRRKIDEGLTKSRYGIVVLSKPFFAKKWPQHELDGLMSKEVAGTKIILPVWHDIDLQEVQANSLMLSGIVAAQSNEGMDVVVRKLRDAMGL